MFLFFLLVSQHFHTAVAKRQHLQSLNRVKAFDLDTNALRLFLEKYEAPLDVQADLEGLQMHFEVGHVMTVVGSNGKGPFSAFISPSDGIVQRTIGTNCEEYHFTSVPTVLGDKPSLSIQKEQFFTISTVRQKFTPNFNCQRVEVKQKEFQLEKVFKEYLENPKVGSGLAAVLISMASVPLAGVSLLEVSVSGKDLMGSLSGDPGVPRNDPLKNMASFALLVFLILVPPMVFRYLYITWRLREAQREDEMFALSDLDPNRPQNAIKVAAERRPEWDGALNELPSVEASYEIVPNARVAELASDTEESEDQLPHADIVPE